MLFFGIVKNYFQELSNHDRDLLESFIAELSYHDLTRYTTAVTIVSNSDTEPPNE